jgi:hypothetical protein
LSRGKGAMKARMSIAGNVFIHFTVSRKVLRRK